MPRITKRIVDNADATEKTHFLWDSELRGFGLRVTPNLVRTYIVQYRYQPCERISMAQSNTHNPINTSPAGELDHHSEVFLTEQELAIRWNISVKKLQADRWKGTGIQYCKFGRAVRFRLSDIIAYEDANTHKSTSD